MKISEIDSELDSLKAKNAFRKVTDYRMESATECVDKNGKKYIVFSSNNYLGLTHDSRVVEAAENCEKFGTGSTGARLTSGAGFELSEFEENIAAFKGTESALVFNTGYMTNLGVLYALANKNDVIFSDELNHASIVDGCRISRAKVVIFKHSDMKDLERLLSETEISEEGQRFIVTDGVFSMDGDIAKLPELVALKEKYNACLIVDDAHSLGVIGKHGGGTADFYGIEPSKVDIQIGTMSKALGAEGGYAASSKKIIDFLKNKSRPFIFSTSLPPSVAKAAQTSLEILKTEGKTLLSKLDSNTKLMRELLKDALSNSEMKIIDGITPIIPIVIGDSKKALDFAEQCRNEGILLCAIRPPSVPEGTSRIRLTVTAAHSEEEIRKAVEIIKKVVQK